MDARPLLLITGGTRGLGLASARHMAKAGWNIALTDLSREACKVYGEAESVESVCKELKNLGAQVMFKTADLTDENQALDLVQSIESEIGPIEGLVAAAGGDIRGVDPAAAGGKAPNNTAFAEHDDFMSIFNRNFQTCAFTCRAVAPKMAERGHGKIVTFASISAGFGVEKETAYAVAKASVTHFTRCLATELRPKGINVNCLAPGATSTGRFRATLKDRTPADLERLKGKSRLERIAEPEDVCKVIEFFLSPAADFVTGQILRVDGGQFCAPI